MILNKFSKLLLAAAVITVSFVSCEKGKHIEDLKIVPEAARFNVGINTASFFINGGVPNGTIYNIPVSVSNASTEDRTLEIGYTSTTGAANGVQFQGPTSVTIPAGEVLGTLQITGLLPGYDVPGRRDAVKIKILSPDTIYNKGSFNLIMQKYCDVVINDFEGDYDDTREVWGTSTWGPYTTSVSAITSTGPTSAQITVSNIFDFGWNPIKFNVDWSNPAAFAVNVVPQSSGIGDAGTMGAAYAGQQVAVRAFAGNPGTFSSCDGTITLRMQLGVAGLGWFGDLYQVTMKR